MAIERTLRTARMWDIGSGYGFKIGSAQIQSPVEVLKLHGSTNWRALLFGGQKQTFFTAPNSLGHRPILYFRDDLEYLDYGTFTDLRCEDTSGAVVTLPFLILPAYQKQFFTNTSFGRELEQFWDAIWYRAANAIGRADEIVWIGYSLPAADQRARNLLLHASRKAARLTIVSGDDTSRLREELARGGFENIDASCPRFEDFVRLALAASLVRADT